MGTQRNHSKQLGQNSPACFQSANSFGWEFRTVSIFKGRCETSGLPGNGKKRAQHPASHRSVPVQPRACKQTHSAWLQFRYQNLIAVPVAVAHKGHASRPTVVGGLDAMRICTPHTQTVQANCWWVGHPASPTAKCGATQTEMNIGAACQSAASAELQLLQPVHFSLIKAIAARECNRCTAAVLTPTINC